MTVPIRRNKNLVTLSHDHHTGLLFCWKIRQGLNGGIDPARITRYVLHFWKHNLKLHFDQEERNLFVLPEDQLVKRAVGDHEQIRLLIETLPNCPADRAQKQLAAIADRVDDHIRFEERGLFPHLEKNLPTYQLEEIGRMLGNESHLPDFYPDQFWVRQ